MRSPRKSQAQQMAEFRTEFARQFHVEYYMGSKWNWNGGYETLAEAIVAAESHRACYDKAYRVRDTAAPFMQTIVHEIEGDRNA